MIKIISLKKLLLSLILIIISAIILINGASWVTLKIKDSMAPPYIENVIIIDPGHGGEDGGSTSGGVLEKDINLAISLKLRDLFSAFGFETVMTRETDISTDNSEKFNKRQDVENRVRLVNSYENRVLISVHMNSFTSPNYRGAQMFYKGDSESSYALAECVMESFRQLQTDNQRVIKTIDNGLYIYRRVDCDVLLAECGFMSNPTELELLRNEEYQSQIALVIFTGYLEFLNNIDDGKG